MVHVVVLGAVQGGLIATCELAFGRDRFDTTGRWREKRLGNRSDVGQ